MLKGKGCRGKAGLYNYKRSINKMVVMWVKGSEVCMFSFTRLQKSLCGLSGKILAKRVFGKELSKAEENAKNR